MNKTQSRRESDSVGEVAREVGERVGADAVAVVVVVLRVLDVGVALDVRAVLREEILRRKKEDESALTRTRTGVEAEEGAP